ncbi:hypothetical protein [Bacillus mobilis]|uniref:hypothetical protein n=1 Tax=Bacillus mobilis TaxID=2026190 RepID=UPI0022E3C3DD|nr:hypothetical protein [Bacillus mobilis]
MALRKNKAVLYIMVFILVYDVQPIVMGRIINLPLIILILFCFKNILQYHSRGMHIKQIKLILVPITFFIICLIEGLVHQAFPHDIGFSYFYIQLIIIMVGLMTLINIYYGCMNEIQFVKFVIYLGVGQAIIAGIMFFSTEIRRLVSYNFMTNARVFLENNEMRGFGLSTSTTFNLTVIQSLILFFIVYIIGKTSTKRLIIYSFFYMLICFSILLAGRTGLIGIGLSLICLCLYSICGTQKSKYRMFIFYLLGIVLLLGANLTIFQSDLTLKWFQWAFEFIYNYKDSGKLTTNSTTEMFQMYKTLPDNAVTFLFGDGRTIEETYSSWFQTFMYYKQVDIGYLRMIFYYGFIFSLVHYVFYTYLIYKATSYNAKVRFLGIVSIIYLLSIELKGLIFTNVSMSIIIIGIYLIYLKKAILNQQG